VVRNQVSEQRPSETSSFQLTSEVTDSDLTDRDSNEERGQQVCNALQYTFTDNPNDWQADSNVLYPNQGAGSAMHASYGARWTGRPGSISLHVCSFGMFRHMICTLFANLHEHGKPCNRPSVTLKLPHARPQGPRGVFRDPPQLGRWVQLKA
jgi:hypothetical protein